jgi:hypothetical protein
MADPFKAAIRHERLTKVSGLILLTILLCALFYFWVRTDISDGREVDAVIVRLGSYPEPLGTGDAPILTVQLPDGSIREVRTSWSAVNRCVPGRRVSLLQKGTALQVALRGCNGMH